MLLSGENQLPKYPGLTRGLVAVLLFYDGQRSLVSSLRTLLQSREGHTWTLGLSADLIHLVSNFTAQLVEDKLVHKILGKSPLVSLLGGPGSMFYNKKCKWFCCYFEMNRKY